MKHDKRVTLLAGHSLGDGWSSVEGRVQILRALAERIFVFSPREVFIMDSEESHTTRLRCSAVNVRLLKSTSKSMRVTPNASGFS